MSLRRLLLVTADTVIAKTIRDFCVNSHNHAYDVTVQNHWKTKETSTYDVLLCTSDFLTSHLEDQQTLCQAPLILLKEESKSVHPAAATGHNIDDTIDMQKITDNGFFRALESTIEKFHIHYELNKQKTVLKRLTESLQQTQVDQKAPLVDLTTISAENLLAENERLIQIVQKQNEELKSLSRVDVLTRVNNRLSFEETLQTMIAHAKRHKHMLGLLMIDLDKFKNVNDSYGHQIGDILLQQAALRFQHAVRKSDVVARLGGDEFAIILNEIKSPHAAGIVAWKILNEIGKPFMIDRLKLSVEASIGIACFPLLGDTFHDLVQNADIAMYQAKKSPALKYSFANFAIQTDYVKREKLKYELKFAVKKGELSVVYQPIYKIPSKKLRGFEALIRWKNESLGEISPAEFIPVAEDTGLIHSISTWVIQTVCKQVAEWKDGKNFPFKISVNLSPIQLTEGNLVNVVNEISATHHDLLDNLEFEITEMAAMCENDTAHATIHTLSELGASHAIDDFGIGFSSIKHLRFLPVATIKIDQTFVQGIGLQKNDGNIVSSIIALGKKMGIKVVAGGVETEEQLNLLIKEECDFVQGYYFSRPLTAGQATELINATEKDERI